MLKNIVRWFFIVVLMEAHGSNANANASKTEDLDLLKIQIRLVSMLIQVINVFMIIVCVQATGIRSIPFVMQVRQE